MRYLYATNVTLKVFFLALLSTCLFITGFSQTVIVKGTIIDKDNKPVDGASVQVKGTNTVAIADDKGVFSISAPPTATLVITNVGFTTQELRINNRTTLSVRLEESSKSMDDVVVIGYQSVTRRITSASISTVKGKDIENMPYPTFDQMLQGRVAGLNVLNVSGEPGANTIVNIRGSSAVANPNDISAPLYVIDGVVFDVSDQRTSTAMNPLASINPNDIESIDILKDASAAAIYGSRAGNGVIIVKTKKPKTGDPQIRVSSYVGVSTKPRMKPMIVGALERRQKMDYLQQQGAYARLNNLSLFLTDSLNPSFNNNTDFQGLFLKEAIIHNVDASIAQSGEKFGYRLSFSRYYEDGVMRGYDFTRVAPRLFLSAKPTNKLEITTDLFLNFSKYKHGPGNTGFSRYPFTIWGFPSSFWQITEQDQKNYTGRNDKIRDDDRNTSFNGNTRIIYKFNKKLIFTSSLSYNFGMSRRDYLMHASINTDAPGRSDAINYVSNSRRWENENFLTYNTAIKDDHNISVLLGQGSEEATNNITNARGNGIATDAIQVIQGIPAGPGLTASTSFEERSRMYYFSRIHYDYKGKYGLDFSYRREGSSRFSANDRWGTFPAVSALWIVSDEKFFEPLTKVVSFMKFRASYGLTGRDPLSYYGRYISLSNSATYQGSSLGAGGGAMTTYNGTTVTYPNYGASAAVPGISWERAPQLNIGADLYFFNDRVSLTAEYYVKDNQSLIFDIPVPITTGFTNARDNYVDIRNRGVEFTLTTQNMPRKSALKWTTTLTLGYNKNYITKLPYNNRDFTFGPPWLTRVLTIGQPAFQFWVWDVEKIYSTNGEIPVDPLTGRRMTWFGGNQFSAGDPARRDVNGDYTINDFDRIYKGDPNTKVQGGIVNSLNYKNFSLQVVCNFITGRKLWNGYLSDKMQDAGTGDPYAVWGPYSATASDFRGSNFWFPNSEGAAFPGLITNNVDKWHIAQTFYVEDASFFRLKNIMLGYNFPGSLTNRAKLKGVRVFGSLDNIWVYSNSTVPDPEPVQPDGYSNGNDYPLPRKFTVGLEVNF